MAHLQPLNNKYAWLAAADEMYWQHQGGPNGHGGTEAHWAAFAGDVAKLRKLGSDMR